MRHVFGGAADQVVIANTKGMTGHAMGTGIEDVVAVKALETGVVPPVANFKEVDPELGTLNLSKGGGYPVEYAIRLGAGFGSPFVRIGGRVWYPQPMLEEYMQAQTCRTNQCEVAGSSKCRPPPSTRRSMTTRWPS